MVACYERVRPAAEGWGPVATGTNPTEDLGIGLRDWLAGCGLVYGALFGIGKLCLGEIGMGLTFLAFAALSRSPGKNERAGSQTLTVERTQSRI